MRINELIQLGRGYLLTGFVVAVFIVVMIYMFYGKIYKKDHMITIGNIIWIMVFSCYMIVIFSATLLDRSDFFRHQKIMPLFYSYKDAWIQGSVTAWRNIILNIIAFIPFGFLIPAGIKKMQQFWKTYLAGFLFTLLIEMIQLITGRGLFEVDDLIYNTLGSIIGYGIFTIIKAIICKVRKRCKTPYTWKKLLLFQIPLIFTILFFAGTYIAYQNQEYGNLSIENILPYEKENFEVSTDIKMEDKEDIFTVYKCNIFTKDEMIKFAEKFYDVLGVSFDKKNIEFYGDAAMFRSDSGYDLWVYYKGGRFTLIDFETMHGEDHYKINKHPDEQEVKDALLQYGIHIPDEVPMEEAENNSVKFEMSITNDRSIIEGYVSGTYYENGRFGEIEHNFIKYDYYKDVKIISPKEAYEDLCQGKFNYYGDEYLNIKVKNYEIRYSVDTKGFYQPYYSFDCDINGEDVRLEVPAIK